MEIFTIEAPGWEPLTLCEGFVRGIVWALFPTPLWLSWHSCGLVSNFNYDLVTNSVKTFNGFMHAVPHLSWPHLLLPLPSCFIPPLRTYACVVWGCKELHTCGAASNNEADWVPMDKCPTPASWGGHFREDLSANFYLCYVLQGTRLRNSFLTLLKAASPA